MITKKNLKNAENLLLRNNPAGFHWNTRNSVSTLGDACGGQNGFTLILKDGHIISYSLGLNGKLESVRISTFLHEHGFSDISHAQIFENILIFTERHASQISIFSWNGRWKQSAVGSVDIIEAISLLYHTPHIHNVDVGLMDMKFCIHEKKPIIFVYNNLALKIYKLVSKASQ